MIGRDALLASAARPGYDRAGRLEVADQAWRVRPDPVAIGRDASWWQTKPGECYPTHVLAASR